MKNVDNFHTLLPIRGDRVSVLSDMSAYVRQDARYTRPLVGQKADFYATLSPNTQMHGTPIQFLPKPLLRLGRDDSHHKVHFGSLTFRNPETGNCHNKDVAIKDCTLSTGLGEVALSQYVMSKGLYAFKPVGVFVRQEPYQGEQLAHMVTEFDEEIQPLDSLQWSDMSLGEINMVLCDVADATARFHEKALFHGDLYFRNFAQKTTGEVVVIDLEHTVGAEEIMAIASLSLGFSRQAKEEAQNAIDRKVRVDFRSIKQSIGNLRPFASLTDARKLRIAKHAILDSYIGTLEESNEPFSRLLSDSAKRAFSAFRAEG